MKLNWQRSGGGIQRDEGVQRVGKKSLLWRRCEYFLDKKLHCT